jgi:hypothetical protein
VRGYYVQSGSKQARFAHLETALAYARETLGVAVRAEARAAGAAATEVTFEQLADGAETYRIRARAVGNPQLGNEA